MKGGQLNTMYDKDTQWIHKSQAVHTSRIVCGTQTFTYVLYRPINAE